MRRSALAILLLWGVLWLALPAVASADNCGAATTAELKFKDCYERLKNTVAGWMGFAVGTAAGWLAWVGRAMSGPPAPPADSHGDDALDKLLRSAPPSDQNPAYDPGDFGRF